MEWIEIVKLIAAILAALIAFFAGKKQEKNIIVGRLALYVRENGTPNGAKDLANALLPRKKRT